MADIMLLCTLHCAESACGSLLSLFAANAASLSNHSSTSLQKNLQHCHACYQLICKDSALLLLLKGSGTSGEADAKEAQGERV